jgi:hypothetical protein
MLSRDRRTHLETTPDLEPIPPTLDLEHRSPHRRLEKKEVVDRILNRRRQLNLGTPLAGEERGRQPHLELPPSAESGHAAGRILSGRYRPDLKRPPPADPASWEKGERAATLGEE